MIVNQRKKTKKKVHANVTCALTNFQKKPTFGKIILNADLKLSVMLHQRAVLLRAEQMSLTGV